MKKQSPREKRSDPPKKITAFFRKSLTDLRSKRIGSDRQTVWILFLFGTILSLLGLWFLLQSDDNKETSNEIIIKEDPTKPEPPLGKGGYILAPAQIERKAKAGQKIYLASAQNVSGSKAKVEVRYLPVVRQSRSGEPLYSDTAKNRNLAKKTLRLFPEESELEDGEILRIQGQVLQKKAPAIYGLLSVSFQREDSQPFSMSSFINISLPGKKRGFSKALNLRAIEEDGVVRFTLGSKNSGNALSVPTVLFTVLEGSDKVWEERISGQGILPGMTRDIISGPYQTENARQLKVTAKILDSGEGEKRATLLYDRGRLLFEDGRITLRGVRDKSLFFDIKNSGTEAFAPRIEASIVLPNERLITLEKNFSKLDPAKEKEVSLALPGIRRGEYNIFYSISDQANLLLEEKSGSLKVQENIKRPPLLKQGYLPLPLILGLLFGILISALLFFWLVRQDKKEKQKGKAKKDIKSKTKKTPSD